MQNVIVICPRIERVTSAEVLASVGINPILSESTAVTDNYLWLSAFCPKCGHIFNIPLSGNSEKIIDAKN